MPLPLQLQLPLAPRHLTLPRGRPRGSSRRRNLSCAPRLLFSAPAAALAPVVTSGSSARPCHHPTAPLSRPSPGCNAAAPPLPLSHRRAASSSQAPSSDDFYRVLEPTGPRIQPPPPNSLRSTRVANAYESASLTCNDGHGGPLLPHHPPSRPTRRRAITPIVVANILEAGRRRLGGMQEWGRGRKVGSPQQRSASANQSRSSHNGGSLPCRRNIQ
jgi:hypothetical protein